MTKSQFLIYVRGSLPVSTIYVKISLEYGHISGGNTTFLWIFGIFSEGRSEIIAHTNEVLPTPSILNTIITISNDSQSDTIMMMTHQRYKDDDNYTIIQIWS